jgi:2-methylisocitrate lyase-like PEP mutase family enzyme
MPASQGEKAERFQELHRRTEAFVIANPWDAGSARILVALGFEALATSSGACAGTLGRRDGAVTRDEALAHARAIVEAVDLPVSADLERCFADEPAGVAETIRLAAGVGLVGGSVEDATGRPEQPLYGAEEAAARVKAAAEAARDSGISFVLTARAENFIRGNPDLGDTIERLQAYQEAGAEVLYAPGLVELADIRSLVSSVDRPVNVLLMPGMAPIEELAAAGVARISVGGTFSAVAFGALARAARELKEQGTYGFFELAREGRELTTRAFRLH